MAHHFETFYQVPMFKVAERSASVLEIELERLQVDADSDGNGSDGKKVLDRKVGDRWIQIINFARKALYL